ncbi:MAG: tetratricopeptide repeat protein [Deinococcus sp.]|nr:tetratricopeptide repeat protein [Deinococcus sp.]
MQRALAALRQGDYDTAFEVLLRTLTLGQGDSAREAALLLPEAYTLYGEGGVEGAYKAIEQGTTVFPDLEAHPRMRAIIAELKALEGAPEEEVRALFPQEPDPQARYHMAQALLYLGVPEDAIAVLQEPINLPEFLSWRAWNLKGKAHEQQGQAAEAAEAYEKAAGLSEGLERYWNLLDAAAMRVEAGEGEAALADLEEAADTVELEDPEDAATRAYLEARAQLLLGNPSLALEAIQKAAAEEHQGAELAHGTPLVKGQALVQLGQHREAMEAFREAVARAEGGDKSYALHELAVAALEAGDYEEAEEALRQVVRDPEYGYLGEAWGDLGEVLYRLSRYQEARKAGLEALAQGAQSAGELVLGHLAYDSVNLEEALEHYQKAVQTAPEGSRDWITAQEMLVDTLAQLGYRMPEEIVARSEAVLPYLEESDEWHQTVSSYLERAKSLMGGRRLN